LPAAEQAKILPNHLPRVSVEAASTFGWARYATHCVGIDTFGASAPGNVVMEKYGITADNVARVAREAVKQ
jgi:transketolase